MRVGTAARTIAVVTVILLLAAACTKDGTTAPPTTVVTSQTTPGSVGTIPLPPPPAPMAVVTRLGPGAAEPYGGDPVEVTAYVLAESPVVGLELWSGSERVDTIELAEPMTRVSEVLTWTAAGAGLHPLLVRAVDVDGRISQSSPMWLRVREAPSAQNVLGPPPGGGSGQTLLASQTGLMVVQPAPQVSHGEGCTLEISVPPAAGLGIAVYGAVLGGGGFAAIGVLGPEGGTLDLPAGSGPVVVYTESFNDAAAFPSAPAVSDPCPGGTWDGDLAFEGGKLTADVDRAYVYVTTDGDDWDRSPAANQTFIAPGADGRFDFSGILPSLDPGGATTIEGWGWKGASLVALGRSTFTVPAPGDGVGASPWQVSPTPSLLPSKGGLDWVVPVVNPTKGEALRREALFCTVPGTTGTLKFYQLKCDNGPLGHLPSKTFRWRPAPGVVTHGVWQVSTVPFPTSPLLTFPGLVSFGPVPTPVDGQIDFEIPNLDKLLAATSPHMVAETFTGTNAADISYEMVAKMATAVAGAGASGSNGSASATDKLNEAIVQVSPTLALSAPVTGPQGLTTTAVDTVYVRVVPIDGAQPQSQVSNPVEFSLDHSVPPPPSPPPKPAFTLAAKMQPPMLPNPSFSHCVRVVENPFGAKNPAPNPAHWSAGFYGIFEANAYIWQNGVKSHKGLIPGATVCALEPVPPEDNWYDIIVDAVNAVAWVWDLYADVYGMLKDKIVGALVFLTGCEAVASEETCNIIANTVVSVAATYVGIPPTMPKFSDLVEAAKGDLKDWIIEVASKTVLDCGEAQAVCNKLADEMLDAMIDTLEKEASKAATAQAKSGGYTLYINPKIKVVPEPAGTLSPTVFQITLTRTAAPSTMTSCKVTGQVAGTTVTSWDADDGFHTNEKVTADLMSGIINVDVTGMKAGQSKTATLVLTKLTDVFLPGQPPWKGSYINPEYDPSTWVFFFSPSVVTTRVSTPCTWGGSPPSDVPVLATWPQDNNPTQPWEIP